MRSPTATLVNVKWGNVPVRRMPENTVNERFRAGFARARKTVSGLFSGIRDKIRSIYNRILEYIKPFRSILIVLFLAPFLYARNLYEYILHFIWLAVFLFFMNRGFNYISTQFLKEVSKASVRELNAEDNVLLKVMGLFQASLLLYIGYIEDVIHYNIFLQSIKWTIPLFTFIVYLTRGYAHVKNSPKYRTYSSLIIIYYLIMEISIFIEIFISSKISFIIGNVNIIEKIFTFVIPLLGIPYLRITRYALAIRYNYHSNGPNS